MAAPASSSRRRFEPSWTPLLTGRRSFSTETVGAIDPYQILGVQPAATTEEIKKAYKKLALQWHPDRNQGNQEAAEKEFKQISKAYAILSNPEQRQQYDLARRYAGTRAGMSAQQQQEWRVTEEEALEMFKQMFGNKPLDEVIREMEASVGNQRLEMDRVEAQLLQERNALRMEAEMIQRSVAFAQTASRQQRLILTFNAKMAEVAEAERRYQLTVSQHRQAREQFRMAMTQIRSLDPRVRLQNQLRFGIAFGVALGSFFFLGYSFLGALCMFIMTNFLGRFLLAARRTSPR